MEELEKNINKRKIYISLLVTVICIISVSYAFFVLYLRQTDNNSVTALSCFTSTLTEENSAINLTNEFPIKDEDGIKKTPFTFKITNNCNNYVKAYITIDSLKEGTANYILSKYMKANISTKGSTDGTSLIIGTQNTKVLDNKHNGYIVKEVGLNSKESKEFDLRLWIDYDTTKEQAAGMTYLSQVVIVTEPGKPTLTMEILANNEVKAPITPPGTAVSTADEALLASAEDDYGTSYYFRGAVTNNYVGFANKCWRIVRIGGDNTVKLILHNDNTANVSNPCSSANNSSTAAFAHYSGSTYTSEYNINYDDNAYVGFMYGTPGSSTYEATHANTNKSTILTNLETWYNNNLKTYESVIADNVFCNDKNISGSGLGYGKNTTDYMSYKRLLINKTPSIKCNGDLSKITSKIGLITTDELVYAGYAASIEGTTNYLNENATEDWWSMSPYDFFGNISTTSVNSSSFIFELLAKDPSATDSSARLLYVSSIGRIYFNDVNSSNIAARPVISLKSSTIISNGTGTSENPYKVL